MKMLTKSAVIDITGETSSMIDQLIENDVLEIIVVANQSYITADSLHEVFPNIEEFDTCA